MIVGAFGVICDNVSEVISRGLIFSQVVTLTNQLLNMANTFQIHQIQLVLWIIPGCIPKNLTNLIGIKFCIQVP